MSFLGFKSVVYDGDCCLGELEAIPVKDQSFRFPNNEIRIHHLSPRSERCLPISVLQTISPFSVRCKLESKSTNEQPHLLSLHSTCFHEQKTAVVLLGEEEIHLVAMLSKQKNYPCFWCYSVRPGLYNACLGMLNLRCLSIVFDLDETLIVANTMKSFEDRIEVLRSWISRETDPVRILGMSAEMKRYMEDRAFLKQYKDNDSVVDNGNVYTVQAEEVPKVLESHPRVVRPVIRMPEKNIVLTRINPEVRDTSVLVRLRPAWDDLRSYLIAKGRKRFEVYVCTMAERDYALEMWRLLDPDAHLISSKQLLDRVVCVKSGARKSLLNVFQDGNCHPKMAMVIDDRLKVWDDKDQPRVHVVPAFTPYYAPQAETANVVPVLCVARNVACNVRGGFFKEFDENLLRSISEIFYEDEVVNLPSAPDVSNYLMPEDASFVPYNNSIHPMAEGMNGPEAAQRLNSLDDKGNVNSAIYPMATNPEWRADISQAQQSTVSTPNGLGPAFLGPLEKPSLLGVPSRRDVSLSESDSDVKKRIPMMNHRQDLRHRDSGDPPLLSRLPGQQSVLGMQPVGGRLTEEDVKKRRFENQPLEIVRGSDLSYSDRPQALAVDFASHLPKSEVAYHGHELQKQNLPSTTPTSVFGDSSSFNGRELRTKGIKQNLPPPFIYIEVLQEIGERCNSKVEFRPVLSTSENLQFSVEVLFAGDKIGVGMGKTRKDAQQQAAENALRNLADKYISHVAPSSKAVDRSSNKLSNGDERGFLWDTISPESEQMVNGASLTKESTSEVAEMAPGSSCSDEVNQQHVRKRACSPRLLESNSRKRIKDERLWKSDDVYQRNGQERKCSKTELQNHDTRHPLESFDIEIRYRPYEKRVIDEEENHMEDDGNIVPPINITFQERIVWFKKNLPRFEIMKSTPVSMQFENRVKEFFGDDQCRMQFFMTWIAPISLFGDREFITMDSLFKAHPNGCLIIISRTMDSSHGLSILSPLVDRGFKVLAVTPDLPQLFKDTPAESWFDNMKSGIKDPGEIPFTQNLSNLIRLAVLYKYGGVYLDTDFIVVKDFSGLRNSIGAQSMNPLGNWTRLNNAVLIFDKDHPLLYKFIEEFALNFNGNKWGYNGPYLVSRVVSDLTIAQDYNFTILPPMAFYPVYWSHVDGFFMGPNQVRRRWIEHKLQQLSDMTYGMHLWNKQSSRLTIEQGSIIQRLISEHCTICKHDCTS